MFPKMLQQTTSLRMFPEMLLLASLLMLMHPQTLVRTFQQQMLPRTNPQLLQISLRMQRMKSSLLQSWLTDCSRWTVPAVSAGFRQ